eukprot:12899784-Prorocentrum_lima.AAC.1
MLADIEARSETVQTLIKTVDAAAAKHCTPTTRETGLAAPNHDRPGTGRAAANRPSTKGPLVV